MRILLLPLVLALLSGCATPYKADGLMGGFSETRLAPDLVRVVFRGNGYTRKQRAQDMALLRAAELADQAGFAYFRVIDEETESKRYSSSTLGTSVSTGTIQRSGNSAVYTGTTNHYPGSTITFFKPETGILVRFVSQMQEDGLTFDAKFIVQSIKEKYQIKE